MNKFKKIVVLLVLTFTAVWSFAYERIAVLSPSGVEILFAIGAGDKIVARTDFCNYPSESEKIPSVGGFDGKTLSVETIVSYNPDLVYGSKGMHDFLEEALAEFGIDLYLSEGTSVQSVIDEITYMGKATGSEKAAKNLVNDMNKRIKNVKKAAGKNKTTVFWQVWNEPFMSFGGDTFINELISIAGGENIFASEKGWPVVSEEAIIASDPSVIIVPSDSMLTVESVTGRAGWENISAVKNNKVVIVDGDICSRPGPRIVEALEILQKIFK